MTEDYGCKVCGKHFEEEEDLKTHGKDDHPEVQEAYPDIFDKDAKVEEPKEAEEFDWDEIPEEEWDDVVLRKVNGEPEEEKPADEIDKQEDKPTQSHDDWLEDLKGLKDDFATEQEKCAICNGEHPTSEHPVTAQEEEEETVKVKKYWGDVSDDERDETVNVKKYWGKKEGEEEGGADEPLSKVDALSESYRFMSRDKRYSLFESLGFGQGDSAVLAGLEWNELTRPIKVEASEVYAKEEDVPAEKETGEDEEEEENKAYESLYNLEKYHSSPDYKKKNLICNRCNESFYNGRDRDVHFNEVHATEQEYELPETCPLCNEIIREPETLDWHMQQDHGAHVSSQYTQTGITGAMADTDFDSLESHKKAGEAFDTDWGCPRCGNKTVKIKYEEGIPVGRECPKCGLGQEAYAKEESIYGSVIDDHFDEQYVMDQDGMYKCKHCGAWLDVHNIAGFTPEEVAKHHLETEHSITESKSSSELKEEIRKQKEFINIASIENPMNMGDAEDKLNNLESELESLGGEELEGTEEEGQEDARSTMKTQKDILDRSEDYDPTLELKYGYPWQEGGEGEGGHQDLDDTTQYPDDPEEDDNKEKKKSTEAEYVDDSDNAGEKYVCPDCEEEFDSDEQLKEHQYANYHGKYKDEGEGEDMPRNVMGGQ